MTLTDEDKQLAEEWKEKAYKECMWAIKETYPELTHTECEQKVPTWLGECIDAQVENIRNQANVFNRYQAIHQSLTDEDKEEAARMLGFKDRDAHVNYTKYQGLIEDNDQEED